MPRLFLPARKQVEIIGGKALVIPEEGWNARTFAKHGGPMILALARVAKITQRRAAPKLASKALAMFKRRLREVIQRATTNILGHAGRRSAKATIDILLPQHADLWREAMDEVFREAGVEVVTELLPEIQSTMAQGYNRTSILMGQEPAPGVGATIARNSRQIAQRVTAVNDTTRRNIARAVDRAIENQLTVTQTAAQIEAEVPQIFGNRSLTIARTELNRAWTQGAVMSFKESETITHISVIGCEAREPNSPQYKGESTCNIQDVPVEDIDQIEFHINHTGNMVPSRFRNPDGTFDWDGDRPSFLD